MKKHLKLSFLCCIFIFCHFSCWSVAVYPNSGRAGEFLSEITPGKMFSLPPATGDSIDISVSVGIGHPKTGFTHQAALLVKNNFESVALFNYLTVSFDTTAVLTGCNFPLYTTLPGKVSFYFDTLFALEEKNIQLTFYIPTDSQLLGQHTWLSASVNSLSFDMISGNNSDFTSAKITGPFDPNAKTVEPEGFGIPNYVPVTQEKFKYTIHFQNTGTDTAIHIIIIDTLSSYLDPLSVTAGASSHPYSWEILAPGILKFHFNNILLPDSSTDEPRSHGFITFTIKILQGLSAGTVIKNTAYIIFDFNAPVATNTTTNELFDCNNLSSIVQGSVSVCAGDILPLLQNTIIPHISDWYVDSVWQAAGDTFIFSSMIPGLHQVYLVAQTPYCSQIITQSVYVNIASKPLITQNGFQLTSTPAALYQWFLNGISITGAQASNFLATQDGWYAVEITDLNGCRAFSDSVYISVSGMADGYSSTAFVYPNPFHDQLRIISSSAENFQLRLTGMEGRLLIEKQIKQPTKQNILNIPELPSGIYILHLSGTGINRYFIVTRQ